MKILLSLYACDPMRGGEPGRSWNWANMYADEGFEVYCLTTPRGRENIETALQKNAKPKLKFIYISVPQWVEKMYYSLVGVYLHYFIWQANAYKIAKQLDKEHNFDLVHHVSYGSIQMGSSLWRLKKQMIFGPLGGGQFPPKAFKQYFVRGWRKEMLRDWVSKLLELFNRNMLNSLKQAKLVLTINQETYQMAKKHHAKEVRMFLDNGLSDDAVPKQVYFANQSNDDVLKLLWVGRLFPRKGLPLVLEALSKVNPEVKFTLTILGGGELADLLPEWLKKYNLEKITDWKGQVPWSEVKQAYLSHDVFLFCSLRESFGQQLLEAMSYGLPIITLNHHGARDFVPENAGFKVPVNEPQETVREIAKAVEYMYQYPEKRVEFGKNSYEFAQTQSWQAKKTAIFALYKELGIYEKP
ncbi:MAG: hypothetical protein OHK0057_09050 [Thermoflexibacter sp.]